MESELTPPLASPPRKLKLLGILFGATLLAMLAYGVYLRHLWGQLEQAFLNQEEFIPTRIYSDVTRIFPPQPRDQIEARLKGLGYVFQKEETATRFTLHPIQYPIYLLPVGHPMIDAAGGPDGSQPPQSVELTFDSANQHALLQSIRLGGNELADLYLEPELIATLSSGNQGEKEIRKLVAWREIANAEIWKAIIAVEDQHFMDHKGFDPRGLLRAIWVNLKTLSFAQGGSTLTQQLVKNLMARRTKNLFRKVGELFLAIGLEIKYEKTQILSRYLDEIYLGQVGSLEIHGVSEGAKYFFGKELEELNLAETAMLAGLIRGPAFYSPYRHWDRAIERQRWVLKKMVETGHIAQAEAEEAEKLPIRLAPPQTSANKAPYFTDFVKAELIRQLKGKISEAEITSAGFRVYTTLDMNLNSAAQRAVSGGIVELEKNLKVSAPDRLEGALAAVDHTTGHIRALIGGRSYAESNFNRILNMKRQVGSTFKPLVYLTAFQRGENTQGVPYGPGFPAEDAPWKLVFDKGRQSWAPRNYDKEFRGWISLRTALAHSINTVAAKLGMEVGIDSIIQTARALGVESELPRVPSLSLGVAELSPVELLRVYATLANHGIQNELTVIRGITLEDGSGFAQFVHHPKEVFPAPPIDLLTDVLQNVFTEGTAKHAHKLGFDRPAAGKTGTTSHHRDSWFAGYTPQLTAVVWVGMDQAPVPVASPEPGKDTGEDEKVRIRLTGAGSALPIWISFMKEALSGEPPAAFPASPHLTVVQVDRKSGRQSLSDCPQEQVVSEKYILGHEPSQSSCEALWPPQVPETVID